MNDDRVIQPVYFSDGTPVSGGSTSGVSFGGGTDPGSFVDVQNIDQYTLQQIVEVFVVYAFIVAFALAAFFIFYGGVSFILSGGNDEKIKQAVNTIRYAIVGLVVTILSFSFVAIVGRIFGLNLISYLSLNKIRESIRVLIPQAEAMEGLEWPQKDDPSIS